VLNHKEIKAVIMVPTYKPAAKFIQKVKETRSDMIFGSVSFVGSDALAEELGPKDAEGVIVTQVVPHPALSNAALVLKYREDLRKYFPKERPNFTSLEGYIDAMILVEALKKTGDDLTTDTLIQSLESIRNLDLGLGAAITYGPSD